MRRMSRRYFTAREQGQRKVHKDALRSLRKTFAPFAVKNNPDNLVNLINPGSRQLRRTKHH